MTTKAFDPLILVIGRNEVESMDFSGPMTVLKGLIASRETIRDCRERVDVSFSGYENTREELFEIPEVRNYVQALDAKFPYWLYFLSRHFLGLQCLAHCFLLPYLTPEARAKDHPQKLGELIEKRWGPALLEICSAAGHPEAEADELLESAIAYFVSGPTKFADQGAIERPQNAADQETDSQFDNTTPRLALKSSQEYVKVLLEKACRTALARPDQEPHSLLLGALFLRAVRALPYAIDQFPIKLSWKVDHGESWGMKTLTIGDEGLSLDTTEGFNSGMGWDHESSVDWFVNESGQEGLDEWVLEDVLTGFVRDVSEPECEVYFSTDSDHEYEEIGNDPKSTDWYKAFGDDEDQ